MIASLPLILGGAAVLTVLLVSSLFLWFAVPWYRALRRIANSPTEHACLQHNTSAGALEWAQGIALAALNGKPAPPALDAPMKLNFPAHCERLGEELLELAGLRDLRDLGRQGPTSVKVLLNAHPQKAMPARQIESIVRDLAAALAGDHEDLALDVVGVRVERPMRGEGLKISLEEMAAVLFEAGGGALLEVAYGGPARRVPAAQVKRMVAKADEMRLRAQELG